MQPEGGQQRQNETTPGRIRGSRLRRRSAPVESVGIPERELSPATESIDMTFDEGSTAPLSRMRIGGCSPGCLVVSLVGSVVLTILLNLVLNIR